MRRNPMLAAIASDVALAEVTKKGFDGPQRTGVDRLLGASIETRTASCHLGSVHSGRIVTSGDRLMPYTPDLDRLLTAGARYVDEHAAYVIEPYKLDDVILPTGWGDGLYPTFIGYTSDGEVACFVADFMVVPDGESAGH